MGREMHHNDSKEQKSSNSSPFIKPKSSGVIQRKIAQHGDVRKNIAYWKPILQKRRALLTKLITEKSNESFEHDFRFLLPLAHRLMEQGGFDKGNTELNNPYYLQSKGDLGYEALTKDEAHGKQTSNFGKFSTEQKGVEAYLEQLENNKHNDGDKTWVGAYLAIMKGSSFQDFIRGLQPDGNVAKGRNYSTKYTYVVPDDKKDTPVGTFGTMMGGMKHRLTNLIQDFIAINTYEIAQLQKEIAQEDDFYETIPLHDRIEYLQEDSRLLQKVLTELKQDASWWKQNHKGVSVQQ
ncbi:hypothetical protein C8N46_106145 [Kordia periserrulae]|uniref:Uncharacterized protein n=1 Tax=Kordia periserrulae TaxID=701523 RepID=A0A2T6BWQ0_9FLAO|nr:hypothetical protein [Kordia periserrulae]PTX60500.1 hypothetical protein C8N46_106145 [Kordia periserrulae]